VVSDQPTLQVVSNEPRWRVVLRYGLIFLAAVLIIAGISFGIAQNRTREIRTQVQTLQERPQCFVTSSGDPSEGCTSLAGLLAEVCRTEPRFCAGIVGEGVANADRETRRELERLIRRELADRRQAARRRAAERRRADPPATESRPPGSGGNNQPDTPGNSPQRPTIPNAPQPPAPVPSPGAGGVAPGPGNQNDDRDDDRNNRGRPGAGQPTVTVPAPRVPPVTTPEVKTPTVTVPPVTVPPITTPEVNPPTVSVPTVPGQREG